MLFPIGTEFTQVNSRELNGLRITNETARPRLYNTRCWDFLLRLRWRNIPSVQYHHWGQWANKYRELPCNKNRISRRSMQDSDSHLFCFCWKHTRVGQLANLTHHRVSFSHVQPQTHAQLSSSVIYDSHLTVGVSNKPMGSLLIVIYKNKLPGQHCKGGIENGRQASHCAVIL